MLRNLIKIKDKNNNNIIYLRKFNDDINININEKYYLK